MLSFGTQLIIVHCGTLHLALDEIHQGDPSDMLSYRYETDKCVHLWDW
jgi:hypothetical protein